MKRTLRLTLRFAKPYKKSFTVLFASILLYSFTGMLYPLLLGRLINEVFYTKSMSAFWYIVLLYALVYLVNQIILIIQSAFTAKLEGSYLFDIKQSMFKSVLSFKGKSLADMHSGDIVSRICKDADDFLYFLAWGVVHGLNFVISAVIAIGFLFYYSPVLAVIIVILTPISVFSSRFFSKKIKEKQTEVGKQKGLISSWLFEIIKGLSDIRLLAADKNVLFQFQKKNNLLSRAKIKVDRLELLLGRTNDGIWLIGRVIVYIAAAVLISRGEMLVGGFVAVAGYGGYFDKCVGMFHAINYKVAEISKRLVAIERVAKILDEETEDYNGSGALEIKKGGIAFKDVKFSYTKEKEVLKGVTFDLKAGSRVALVGRSGEGKTTIANLLLKLYDALSGGVEIDGVPVSDYNLRALRGQIGIVHQDTVLFNGTVRYNLTLGETELPEEDVYRALKKAHLYDFVMGLPDGLDTVLGTKGQQLSGGQKQRLAIARVFIKNPKILIFDEATSALDSEAESAVTEAWDELCMGRTIIIIAHRLSTILNADAVMVLSGGCIAGIGEHDALLASCKPYIELFKEQYALEEKEEPIHA